ncbi:WUSCHEL-related homeobox 7 [Zea mays]|uniref:WUSCHEL-related homeobox 7 n=1 Tax=Zea mays TaxID=4577 RepID=UPI000221EAF5|nr:WUSCHEL-related homeobox 7 [Zea mays]|eukprot:XP_008675239.1 WUSCHEL-related homeobox 7 isoform X2 [Zea mays]
MASSSFNNSHWPSMFRSKHAAEPCQTTQPDISSSPPSLLSAGGASTTTTTGRCLKHSISVGGEERAPDPKPRWNPRPEQIRILEAIFNSGMVNPPRDEIPRIRMRLQQYGQVGDANVFYWFQNRKSRSKNKLRSSTAGTGRLGLQGLARAPGRGAAAAPPPVEPPPLVQNQFHMLASPAQAPTSSSSSSSDRSSGSSKPAAEPAMPATAAPMDLLGPLAAACPQMYYQGSPVAPAHKVLDLVASVEPVFQPWPQGYCLSAAEVATILGGQYMHVPVQQQPPAPLPAGALLGLCNDVTEPTAVVTGHKTCAWGPAGLGQSWPCGGADHHQPGKNNNTAARELAHEDDATKLGLLQYGFGATTAMEAAPAVAPLAASPAGGAVTMASVSASTAGLTGFPASTNGVVANYDLLQGLAVPGGGAGAGRAPAAVAVAADAAPTAAQEGVVALCITDSITGKSVAHNVAAARLDVRAQFGEAAVLLRCGGERGLDLEPVPVDASGCTVEPLQRGAFYYVLL